MSAVRQRLTAEHCRHVQRSALSRCRVVALSRSRVLAFSRSRVPAFPRSRVPYVPKSNPGTDTRGISCPITRSIVRTIPISSADMNV